MANEINLSLELDDEEQEIARVLQEEMGLGSMTEVIHMLVRQARLRTAVVCPTCGHVARKTTEDVAECQSCLSILRLSEDIWTVVSAQDRGVSSGG